MIPPSFERALPRALRSRPAEGAEEKRAPRPPCIVGVGGGKGGIGKSLVSASIGIDLALRGRRVVLLDADLGGANLHTCLGIEQPALGLADFLARRLPRLEDALTPTGVEGLALLSGAQDPLDAANPKHHQKLRLLRAIKTLRADYVVLDIGSGTSFNVLDFFLLADHGILTLVPEPTSVENGYRFLKAALYRRLRNFEKVFEIEQLLGGIAARQALTQGPRAFLAAVSARDESVGRLLAAEMRAFRPRLVVNMARSAADLEVGGAVVAAWRKFFGLEMDYLGCIGYDDDVWRCVRLKRPLLLQSPGG